MQPVALPTHVTPGCFAASHQLAGMQSDLLLPVPSGADVCTHGEPCHLPGRPSTWATHAAHPWPRWLGQDASSWLATAAWTHSRTLVARRSAITSLQWRSSHRCWSAAWCVLRRCQFTGARLRSAAASPWWFWLVECFILIRPAVSIDWPTGRLHFHFAGRPCSRGEDGRRTGRGARAAAAGAGARRTMPPRIPVLRVHTSTYS